MKINAFLLICAGMAMVGCSSDDSDDSPGTPEACEKPTGLSASELTDSSADLGWTEAGSATTWDIELGTSGFEPTGEATASSVSNPYTATELSAETAYEFYVRADCGDDQSEWSGPLTFTTSAMESSQNYFPLAEGNSWDYTNKRDDGGATPPETQETLTAGAATENNGMMYYPMTNNDPEYPGFVTDVFSGGTFHQDGGQMIYDGSIVIDVEELYMEPVVITMDNAVIFNATAAAGTELFTYSGSETQEVNIGVSLPVTINYTAKTTNVEFLDSYTTPNGEVYEDVLRADMIVVASASSEYNGTPIPLMIEQNAITTTNYYANGVGMIYSEVIRHLEFEDLSAFGLPNIPDVHNESSQELSGHTLN